MRLRALLRRLALPPVAAGLAVAGLALPAQADDPAPGDVPMVLLNITDAVTVIDGQAKTVKFEVHNFGGAEAKDVVIGFANGLEPVPADIGFVPPAGCSAAACEIDKLAAGERRGYTLTVRPDVSSTTNLTSYFDVTSTVGGEETDKVQVQVVRTTESGVDIEVAGVKDMRLGRGQSADVPLTVRNTGNAPSGALGVVLLAQSGVEPILDYRNCEKDTEVEGMVCLLDEPLPAGAEAGLPASTPVRIRVGADTPGPADYYGLVGVVGLTDDYAAAFRKRNATRTGAALKLETTVSAAGITDDDVTDDLNPADNIAEFAVRVGRSEADSKAIGGAFTGTAGDLSTVKVGSQNLGPTAKVPFNSKWDDYVHVNVPTNVKLTEVDPWCLPGTAPNDLDLDGGLDSRDWVCFVLDQLPRNGKALFTFQAMIQEGAHEAGYVRVDGGPQDSRHGNDKAALTVASGDEDEVSLPITGPSAGLLAAGGAVVLVAGVIAFRMARRRRIVTVVE
ncbi:hypothetical protein FHX34_1011661 [Actinoplanes teichomyceticus]|uniref:LPXTG-motif cell wall-anchored protein n=2 Tax=Actinoplanes teichomyceticus TaxID=1867 RepID=A0A561WS24_ACTTI|nr:hypothetical protein FHX34_1011661 [Actinoplanes teichomyceticus]GIF15066.1 hypothetical protein Ate01nite_50980 [Actinoplanes teichomyceticus]